MIEVFEEWSNVIESGEKRGIYGIQLPFTRCDERMN